MKRVLNFLIAVSLALSMSVAVFANDNLPTEQPKVAVSEGNQPVSNVNLTVVIPKATEKPTEIKSEIAPPPVIPKLYPVNVYESQENGTRQIIKTYELADSEIPTDIPRDSFDRDGWHYELTDIIKKETASADMREHTKTVAIDTDTKELDAIIKLLAPTVEFTSDDGYAGVLTLDVKSITVETAGTKKNSFTVSAVREYPHLSSNDTSLVPKTIYDNGRTLTLANLQWKTQTSSSVDYEELPNSYTAVVTYTTTGSKTVVTGYSTTAEYKGAISKMITGKTVYTAIFNGAEILPEPVPFVEQKSEITDSAIPTETPTETTTDTATETPEPTPLPTEIPKAPSEKTQKPYSIAIPILISVIAGLVFIGGFAFFMQSRKNSVTPITEELKEKNDEEGDFTE